MAAYTIIRSVTEALVKLLEAGLTKDLNDPDIEVKTATPETIEGVTEQTLILYLYQVVESPFLKNTGATAAVKSPLQPGAQGVTLRREPLSLDLHYLLIPFSGGEENLFNDAYDILGSAMKAFHDNATFCPGALGVTPMTPEDARLEFRLSLNPLPTSDLIRLWEAVHAPYRLSVAYVVRTVQIDSDATVDGRLVAERRLTVTGG